jgi:hypothetical protein
MPAAVSGGRSRNRVHHPRRLCPLAPALAIACPSASRQRPRPGRPGVSLLRESKGGRYVFTIGAVAVAVVVVVVVVVVAAAGKSHRL